MKGRRFSSNEEMIVAFQDECDLIPKQMWEEWFDEWFRRMRKYINCDGKYFERLWKLSMDEKNYGTTYVHWEKVLVVVTHFFFCKKGHKYVFYSVSSKHLSSYSYVNWAAMINISSKTYKIRLVGPFCSRDYFHAFAHCIDLIIEVTNTFL